MRRKANAHGRSETTVLPLDRDLLGEIAVRDHSRQLHDPTQRHLSPASADVRRAQGVDQVAGLALQLPVARGERAQLLLETPKPLPPTRPHPPPVLLVKRARSLQ